MHPVLTGNGEIKLLSDDKRIVAVDGLEAWQLDSMVNSIGGDSCSSNNCLANIDSVVADWLKTLTKEDWNKIKRQNSLFGIRLPDKWIKTWRGILKEPELRDAKAATRGGRDIGSFRHLWNIWSEQSIEQYLNEMEKELLSLVDSGYMYSEIGDYMFGKYGEEFWKPRKENSKTTSAQVVNNYLYWKMPNKITRCELTHIVLRQLRR